MRRGAEMAPEAGWRSELEGGPMIGRPTPAPPQAFMEVYATLRDELLNDKLLGGPPKHAVDWLKEVSPLSAPQPSAGAHAKRACGPAPMHDPSPWPGAPAAGCRHREANGPPPQVRQPPPRHGRPPPKELRRTRGHPRCSTRRSTQTTGGLL
jgi:hypothetical protein